MKKLLSFVIFLCVAVTMLVAQPQKMSYQTVVRDANNELVVNKTIGMKVSVLHDSINGGAVYVETHNATTNSNGLVTIQIGGGTPVVVTNTLADVDWKNRRTFLKVEIDPNGGITYTITGVQEFMTVPYAFIANAATSSTYADTALFLMNAHNSDTAQFAYHSDTANYAVNANHANSAATATSASSANSANYSDSARIANSAISANYATNANHSVYADTATYALNAGHAANSDTALFSMNAGHANYSDTSVYAYNANVANSANTANSANYADSTRIANSAISANYATNANHSVYADTATYALNAGHAANSDTALFSMNAGHANHSDTSVYAYNANVANSANTANSANYADSTRIANTAISANYATNANYANGSAYADSSNYDNLANRPVGTNKGDLLYWDTSDNKWHVIPVGNSGEILTMDTNSVPYWSVNSGGGMGYTAPTVVTGSVSNITGISATGSWTVTDGGGTPLVVSGVCWSTSQNPTLLDNYISNGLGVSNFSSQMTGLSINTTYYVRAYASNNSTPVSYGNQVSFTTPNYPTVVTDVISNIQGYSATSGGNVTSDGGATITARGVCWSTSHNPTISNYKTNNGTGTGAFSSSITGLNYNTKYYVRAYATNVVGTVYGQEDSLITLNKPTVTTDSAVINGTTATTGGNVTSDGGASVTARGICYNTYGSPTIYDSKTTNGSGLGTFTSTVTSLQQGVIYYVRAYATNSVGTSYGNEVIARVPTLPTIVIDSVVSTNYSATAHSNITDDGGAPITARGICWSTNVSPTLSNSHTSDGTGSGTFTSSITGLSSGTVYFARAYATNSAGTAYSDYCGTGTCYCDWSELYFYDNYNGYNIEYYSSTGRPFVTALAAASYNTTSCGTVTDVDGNTYNTIQIGTQCWMKENLRTTQYNNYTSIPLGTSTNNTTAYRYYPNNNSSNVSTYGYLYNATAAANSYICPTGWHVPTSSEWTTLTNYVNSQSSWSFNVITYTQVRIPTIGLAANKGWTYSGFSHYDDGGGYCYDSESQNFGPGATPSVNNASGFSALPAGYMNSATGYYGFGTNGYFWSSNQYNTTSQYYFYVSNYGYNTSYTSNYRGHSIRCLKN